MARAARLRSSQEREHPQRLRADLYDWECEHVLGRREQDLHWLVEVVQQWAPAGPVLELACGTGRVTVPLATRTGLAVVGLDLDPQMLAGARARGARRLVQGDMRTFHLAARFPLVLVAYNSLQLLDGDGALACLRTAAGHLSPAGAVALECTDFQRDVVSARVEAEPLGEGTLPGGEHVVLTGSLDHDLAGRTSTYRRRFVVDGNGYHDAVVIRSLDREELVDLVQRSGLIPHTVDVDGARTRLVATLPA